MNNKLPLVSVILPTCNRVSLLRRALLSVLNQSYSNIEIIVINDGSIDGTYEMLQVFEKENACMKVIHHKESEGANKSRNDGINMSSGVFIAGLDDDDDEFTPDRIKKLMLFYDDKSAFVASNEITVKPDDFRIYSNKKSQITFDEILYQNYIGNQGLISRERIISVGMYDEAITATQDYDLWIRLMHRYGTVKISSEHLYIKHEEHGFVTITTSKKVFSGYFGTYKKYKHLLNIRQRKMRFFHLYRIRRKKLSFKNFIRFQFFIFQKQMLRYYINQFLKK